MYFGVSVVNNWALSFDIPMPLHMIFRAGSLIANMIMGMLILGRRYSGTKYLAVLAIRYESRMYEQQIGMHEDNTLFAYVSTLNIISYYLSVGIGLCTIVSSKQSSQSEEAEVTDKPDDSGWKALTFATGIFMLTFALFMSARMGIYQEVIYSKYGKHAKEALYYSHCLPLAGFLLLYKGNAGQKAQE